jgi:hypothetical protein
VTPGTRIEYLVVRGGGEGAADDKMNAVPAGDPGVMEQLDRDYYWDKLVYPPTQRLLEAVYPRESWADTAAQRRKAAQAQEREANKDKYDDLPLFEAPPTTAPLPESVHPGGLREGAPPPAPPVQPPPPRRRRPLLLAREATQEQPLVLQLLVPEDGQGGVLSRVEALLEAVAAAARAHPGEAPVVVDIHVGGVATARVKTEARMSRGRDAVAALQRLTTPGVLQLVP